MLSTINNWLHNRTYTGSTSLAEAQTQQTKARILLTIASLTYVIMHGEHFEYYMVEALTFSLFYFLANSAALFRLRHKPFAAPGSLFFPLLDVAIVTFGMLIDGGHSSGIFFMLLPIIIGNGLRFGNTLLIFAQGACLVGMLTMTAYSVNHLKMGLDPVLLFWQVFTLLAVPFYVYLIVKKLEKAIEEKNDAEQASFHLIDKGPLPVFTFNLDHDGKPSILYANKAVRSLFLYQQPEIVGTTADRLVLPEDSREMINFCQRAFHGPQGDDTTASIYIRGCKSSGEIIKMMATSIRMRWHNRWIGVCFLLDVTERETLQEQMEAVHRQGYMSTLVAGIVHDFRNVLTNMIGNAEVLEMNSSNSEQKQQIEAIIEAGERGSNLITHLLNLSRSSNRRTAANQYTSGDSLIQPLENIIGLARLQLPHNVRLHCEIDSTLPDVAINTTEIEQLLLNLINNSRQAISGQGFIQVHIFSETRSDKAYLCITVSDNGEGISEEHMDSVFKPFWTSRADTGGTGLGLTMVQRIVKQHHGSIDIVSPSSEQGTTVTICFPGFKQTEPAAISQSGIQFSSSGSKTTRDLKKIKPQHILLVDDMPDILRIHQAMLSRMGHSALMAESVDQALSIYAEHRDEIDLIITDYRMPNKDGLELVEAIRADNREIPILMITAYGEDEQLQRAGSFGVTLMNKPVTIDRMHQTIAEVTDHQNQ